MIFGEGMYRYRVVEGWDFTGIAGDRIGVYAFAVDSEDRVYDSNHGDHPVIIFDREDDIASIL